MTDRVVILAAVSVAGLLLLGLLTWYRSRDVAGPERLEVDDLGLELMAGCCAFVVFTTPTCRPCKAALRVVTTAAARTKGPTEVVAVDAIDRSELALRWNVRTIPTTFLITASGHVVHRWRNVPEPTVVDAALAEM